MIWPSRGMGSRNATVGAKQCKNNPISRFGRSGNACSKVRRNFSAKRDNDHLSANSKITYPVDDLRDLFRDLVYYRALQRMAIPFHAALHIVGRGILVGTYFAHHRGAIHKNGHALQGEYRLRRWGI